MNIKQVNINNLINEHICCAITDSKGENCVASKKAWLEERFADGLIFKKADVRGKVFIEYLPADKAWCPIIASDYMYINCFWVSGQYKGQGMANKLLAECISDSRKQGKKGIVVLSSLKKRPFLSDAGFLKYKGFVVADTAVPYYQLLYLPFTENAAKPKFKECTRQGKIDSSKDFVLYYSNQCPHTEKYAMLIADIAKVKGVNLTTIKYQTMHQAQNAPAPFTTYSLFYDGEFLTNEILSAKKFLKLLTEKGF